MFVHVYHSHYTIETGKTLTKINNGVISDPYHTGLAMIARRIALPRHQGTQYYREARPMDNMTLARNASPPPLPPLASPLKDISTRLTKQNVQNILILFHKTKRKISIIELYTK